MATEFFVNWISPFLQFCIVVFDEPSNLGQFGLDCRNGLPHDNWAFMHPPEPSAAGFRHSESGGNGPQAAFLRGVLVNGALRSDIVGVLCDYRVFIFQELPFDAIRMPMPDDTDLKLDSHVRPVVAFLAELDPLLLPTVRKRQCASAGDRLRDLGANRRGCAGKLQALPTSRYSEVSYGAKTSTDPTTIAIGATKLNVPCMGNANSPLTAFRSSSAYSDPEGSLD